ncbi:DUF664 domain-containing protein [Chryseolinea lacunae]|uniref:DUF664 domain-containing protein n=1 Tax=Chryseolinea lacunae TaxID=2801331 RepID=A0ABS1KNQ7_9BACT|nr:DUF664 domain-containing protein [Chryseolinea lacunae]MBL0741061.1 DUF664 domain-containing protein [Chryseolinea lacunae]
MTPPDTLCETRFETLLMLLETSKENISQRVSELANDQLDFFPDDWTPSIGTLLRHMIATEDYYRVLTFENRKFNTEEGTYWNGSLSGQLLTRRIKGNPFDYYATLWADVRNKTSTAFIGVNDKWTTETGREEQDALFFAWYHILEDHLCHFGQIKSIISKLKRQTPIISDELA